MQHRFLLDNDGSNIFFTMAGDPEARVAEAVRECAPNVTSYLLCSGAGTQYYPTEVGTVCPRATPLREAHQRGLDPFGMFLQALRAAGKETFVTCRMNDVHDPDDPSEWNLPAVRREHPDVVVDPAAIQEGRADWMCWCLDYSRPEVQDYELALLRELVERYDFDGLQLDWMRFPRHLSGTPEQVWGKREALTEFTARVWEMLAASGKQVLLAARVPTSLAGCQHLGMDLGEWARRGLVDLLVASPFLTTDFAMPLAEMRAALGEADIPLYAACDLGHGPQIHCPESLRAMAAGLYGCGADGLYLFNFPCWNECLAARPYHWLEGLETPAEAARKPLLFSVAHHRYRVAGVDLPGQIPAPLPAEGSLGLRLTLPQAALPAWRALLLAETGGDVSCAVNGTEAQEQPEARHSEMFVEYLGAHWQVGGPPGRDDCRAFLLSPQSLRTGENVISLANRAGEDLEVRRANLGLW